MKYYLHTMDPDKILDHGCDLPCNLVYTFNQGMANEFCRIIFQNFGSVATSNEA